MLRFGISWVLMPQSLSAVYIHLVFSTKERRPFLRDRPTRDGLHSFMSGISKQLDSPTILVGGVEDHVHLLARLRPDRAVSDLLRDLKSNSSGWLHDVFPDLEDFSWQRGYGAFTVSQSNVTEVTNYIAHQKEHHQRISGRDEFIQFLRANEIEFDERFV